MMRVCLRGGCEESSALLQSAACDDLQSVFWILRDGVSVLFPTTFPRCSHLASAEMTESIKSLGWAGRLQGGRAVEKLEQGVAPIWKSLAPLSPGQIPPQDVKGAKRDPNGHGQLSSDVTEPIKLGVRSQLLP